MFLRSRHLITNSASADVRVMEPQRAVFSCCFQLVRVFRGMDLQPVNEMNLRLCMSAIVDGGLCFAGIMY
jgi:hypothetical protein